MAKDFISYFLLKTISGLGLSAGSLITIFADLDPIKWMGAIVAAIATIWGSWIAWEKVMIDKRKAEAEIRQINEETEAKRIENERKRQEIVKKPPATGANSSVFDGPGLGDDIIRDP